MWAQAMLIHQQGLVVAAVVEKQIQYGGQVANYLV